MHKNLKSYIILIIVSIILTFMSLCILKNGFYVDEIYSYGLAHSSTGAFLDGYRDISVQQNPYALHDHWLKGKIFHDYLTVQPYERFQYSHIIKNLKNDVHPPLYFILLHTIDSFIPDTFNKYPGLLLNGLILILLIILFNKASFELLKDKKWALAATFLFAFLPITLETEVYIRMYLLEMAFFIGLIWQALKIINDKKFVFHQIITTYILATCCFLTHFYGLIYAFFLTLGTIILLLLEKHYRLSLLYGIIMLSSVLTTAIIFPPFLNIILFSERGLEISQITSKWHLWLIPHFFEFLLNQLSVSLFFAHHFLIVWSLIVLCVLLLFYKNKLPKIGYTLFIIGLITGFFIVMLAPNMGRFNSRYYVGVIPLIYLSLVLAFKQHFTLKIFCYTALILSVINFSIMLHNPFLDRNSDLSQIQKTIENKKVLLQRHIFPSIFVLAPALQKASDIYIIYKDEDIKKHTKNNDFPVGSIFIQELTSTGTGKFQSKTSYATSEYGLKYNNMYEIDYIVYDAYEKTAYTD